MENLKFKDLNLSRELQKAIGDMGFEEASPIQSQGIPNILEGRDVIGQAQTGTGKTAAFGIPALEMINTSYKKPQAVVLCPTRELAIQVSEEIKKLSKYKNNIKMLPVYGGQPIERQIRALKEGVQIVIGTPGRIMDHMNRGTLKIDSTKMIVLDEADQMLDMGFREDIETILTKTSNERQTVLFSATMPKSIMDITNKYQKDPKLVKVVHKKLTVPQVEQIYYEVKEKAKPEVLTRLIDMYSPKLSLVFCNTKKRVDELVLTLKARGYPVEGLHGDMKQAQRNRVMSKFRNGSVEILVATDVAARGIDVNDIEAVFNYDFPQDEEYYVHRIGRTGRAGRNGHAFTFVVGKDIYKLKNIQRYTKAKVTLHNIPSLDNIEEIKISSFLEKVKNTIEEGNLSKYHSYVEKLMSQEFTSLDIAAALVKLSMDSDTKGESFLEENLENTGAESDMVRLFVNAGKNHKISAKDIVGGIAGNTGMSGNLIGAVKVFDKYTFVEVPKEYAKDVIKTMKDNEIKGNKIKIEPAKGK